MFITIGTALAGIVGREVTAKAAKVIGVIAGIVLLVTILGIGKCAYDNSIINDYKQDREAEIDKGLLKAERAATAEDAARDQDFAESAARVAGDTEDAKNSDPNGGKSNTGPVTQSYFDSLRRDGDSKARSK